MSYRRFINSVIFINHCRQQILFYTISRNYTPPRSRIKYYAPFATTTDSFLLPVSPLASVIYVANANARQEFVTSLHYDQTVLSAIKQYRAAVSPRVSLRPSVCLARMSCAPPALCREPPPLSDSFSLSTHVPYAGIVHRNHTHISSRPVSAYVPS